MYIIHYSYYKSMCEMASNKSQTLEYYRTGTAPPGFEIPGSAPEYGWFSRFLIS